MKSTMSIVQSSQLIQQFVIFLIFSYQCTVKGNFKVLEFFWLVVFSFELAVRNYENFQICLFVVRMYKYPASSTLVLLDISVSMWWIYPFSTDLYSSYVKLLHRCPRLGEGWDQAHMFNLSYPISTICVRLSQVKSLSLSGCRMLMCFIFVFRSFLCSWIRR